MRSASPSEMIERGAVQKRSGAARALLNDRSTPRGRQLSRGRAARIRTSQPRHLAHSCGVYNAPRSRRMASFTKFRDAAAFCERQRAARLAPLRPFWCVVFGRLVSPRRRILLETISRNTRPLRIVRRACRSIAHRRRLHIADGRHIDDQIIRRRAFQPTMACESWRIALSILVYSYPRTSQPRNKRQGRWRLSAEPAAGHHAAAARAEDTQSLAESGHMRFVL